MIIEKTKKIIITAGSTAISIVVFWELRKSAILPDISQQLTSAELFAVSLAYLTSPTALICITLLAAFLAVEAHHVYAWLHIVVTLVIVVGLSWLLKELTAIPRPKEARLVAAGLSEYAFPSIHTASATAIATLIAFHAHRLANKYHTVIYPAVVVGVWLVGFSRLALHAHALSDILAGITLGLGTGLISATLWSRWYQFLSQLNQYQPLKGE